MSASKSSPKPYRPFTAMPSKTAPEDPRITSKDAWIGSSVVFTYSLEHSNSSHRMTTYFIQMCFFSIQISDSNIKCWLEAYKTVKVVQIFIKKVLNDNLIENSFKSIQIKWSRCFATITNHCIFNRRCSIRRFYPKKIAFLYNPMVFEFKNSIVVFVA